MKCRKINSHEFNKLINLIWDNSVIKCYNFKLVTTISLYFGKWKTKEIVFVAVCE